MEMPFPWVAAPACGENFPTGAGDHLRPKTKEGTFFFPRFLESLEEVGSSLTRAKKWGDELFGGATMHTTALYLKTNSFTNSIVVVFLLVFLVNFTIGIPSAARQEHGGGDFQAMRQRVQKIGTWRSENRTCCVWRGQVGNGKFWFLGLKIRPKF